jgi:hypothetical protein
VGLVGLLTPFIFNLGGLVLPFLHLGYFEQHHGRINQVRRHKGAAAACSPVIR